MPENIARKSTRKDWHNKNAKSTLDYVI